MANSYPAPVPVNALQVGSYFVQQYYHVLQQQPDYVHHFYTDASTVIRIDGDSSESASAMVQIHTLIMSLNFSGIEIKTINSLESWSGGVLVVVSGSVKSKEFSDWRKFVQTFFLAPQEKGYFVLNDIFHFLSEEVIHQHPAPILSENIVDYQHPTPILQENRVDYQHPTPILLENRVDSQLTSSSPVLESPDVPDYEVETSEHFDSVHIEGEDPVEEYSLQDQQQEEEPVVEFLEETPVEESSALLNEVDCEQEPPPAVEESIGEPQKFTYASILQAAKGKTVPSVAAQPYLKKTSSSTSEWHPTPQPTIQPNSVSSFVPESSVKLAEEGLSQEGESKSVYVKNLPPTVSTLDILQEFENFGRIKLDGVFIRNRKEHGVCFAFVEFEDVESVQNAIKASPIQLVGRQAYIEERRPSSSSSSNISRGGRRGRGSYQHEGVRGRFGGRTFGRGNNQDGSDNYRSRGNGVRGSY